MHVLGFLPLLVLSEQTVAEEAPATPPPAVAPADTPPPRPRPRFKGVGLLATGGALAGTSLALTIARSVLLKKNCPLEDPMGAAQCTYDFGSDIGLAASTWSINLATIGFAAPGGVLLGRYHAWEDSTTGRVRKAETIMGVGGGLLGAGIVGVGTSIGLAFALPARCVDKELQSGDPLAGDRCLLKAFPAWTMTNWASFAMIGTGSAMLGYGIHYRKHRGTVLSQLQPSPFFGRTYAGIGMSGRF
jgi:hypothetical protein